MTLCRGVHPTRVVDGRDSIQIDLGRSVSDRSSSIGVGQSVKCMSGFAHE